MTEFPYNRFILFALFFLLIGCQDPTAKPESSYEHAVEGSYAATISDDGKYSLVSSIHHGVSLWDLEKNALKYQWSHQGAEHNITFLTAIAPDNSYAMTADKEKFGIWNIETGQSEGFIKIRESTIRDIAISNQGRYLLIGKTNGKVVHVDRDTGRRIEFVGHQEKINSVALSPNGFYALSGSNDYVAFLWDTRSGQVVYRFNHPSRVSKVAFDPKGRFAFTADSQKQARIWDLKTGEPVSRLIYTSRQQIYSAIRFNKDATLLATGSPSRKLAIWDIQTGKQIKKWFVTPRKDSRPKSAVVYSIAFSQNDTKLITESSSGLVETWQIKAK